MPDVVHLPSDLLLRVTPPRAARELLARAPGASGGADPLAAAVVLVQAPAGFGKTSLLAQWRLDCIARGAAVAWLSSQGIGSSQRLLQALALSVRQGAGRPTFGHVLLEGLVPPGLEGFTAWLVEVAQAAFELVLMVDEADRLPDGLREDLAYLVRNAPPNLRCVIASRPDVDLGLADLVVYGQCQVIGAAQLRFTLEETLQLAQRRLGTRFHRDRCARLHEQMEGWPLGIQMALALAAGGQPLDFNGPAAGAGGLHATLMGQLLGKLSPQDLDFVTRTSLLQHLHPSLCEALLPGEQAGERLERLARDTPVFVAGELQGWYRLHSLAREVVREGFDALPAEGRSALHRRASTWLAAQGLLEVAARQSLAAGEPDKAYDLAERSLYDTMLAQGRQSAVMEWLAQVPIAELHRRPRLMLALAWSLAISERHDEARRIVDALLAGAAGDEPLQCECALILAGAALFADDPDRFAALHDPWADRPPLHAPRLLQVHANRSALRALLAGDPALARLRQQAAPRQDAAHLDRWGEVIIALSYAWEGQPLMVEQLLAPCLATADNDLGRRSRFAAMVAATLAASRWELGRADSAAALLADRLDVLERSGLPEAVLLGFRTLARIAVAAGQEQQALDLLGALQAVGRARALARLELASLSEQLRLHARHYRAATCRELLQAMEALHASLMAAGEPPGPLWQQGVQGWLLLARAYAAIAAREWRAASAWLAEAEALAAQRRQGRERLEAMALHAWALDRCGERTLPLVQEVQELAQAAGLARLFEDAHPDLAAWMRSLAGSGPQHESAAAPMPTAAPASALPRAAASAALTPKERRVLELLARSLSNKEIALALQVGEETVKWHLKNLFAKLDAGTRKQVVDRARILGLLSG
ncbi:MULTISPECIES: LuxR C-terminal-related transcriptional regulator [Ramlibacter]|uniref:LuxR family transcriptional regulator n=1 Tax=Ramlibacter aquaticus TaxID=2780094 RepID=A0ABR9SD94_9BURK|nr:MULTISPECIES: LuxR C-terminal-related transcriptional regulator [Ramlibacter]MBE7940265.1 LuxR family transcriptional regulator [Ramlibacter aquaticus]